jgi:FIMAH domain-containing protein
VDATAPAERVDATAPVQRATPVGHRRARSFPWAIVGAVVLGALVVAALAMALGSADLKQAARQAARDANQQSEPTDSPTDSPTTVLEPPAVDDAYAGLVAAIAQAEGAQQLEEKVAAELGDRADKAFEAYQAGDAEEVQKQIEDFGQKLAEATDKDEISVEAADNIRAALNELVLAIGNDPPEAIEEPVEDSSDNSGPGNSEGKGHGDGNGKGHGND